MGLFDRFKTPKWKDKNWEVRLESIEELDDREILTDLAVNDDTYGVRVEAARKLLNDVNDEKQLLEIYENNSPIFRQVAAEKICDENILTDIAKNDEDVRVRATAVEKIRDESVLIDLLNDESVDIRVAATKNIEDESVLINLARNDKEWLVRNAAVENIRDESVLGLIAKTDAEWYVRATAVKNLNDVSILTEVAKNEEEILVQNELVKKIYGNYVAIKETGLQCDVCNKSIRENGYYVPNIIFYNSVKYQNWLINNVPNINNINDVHQFISMAQKMDNSGKSAVCDECIDLFEKSEK